MIDLNLNLGGFAALQLLYLRPQKQHTTDSAFFAVRKDTRIRFLSETFTLLIDNCSGYWEGGLRCALIRCTLGSGKSEKGWDFGGEGTRGQWGTKGNSLQATWDRGGRFLSQLEGAK
jgi:hypothetical protein